MGILSTVSPEEPIDIGCPDDEYALLERGERPRQATDASFASRIKSPSSGASSLSKSTTSQDETYDGVVHNGEEYRMLLDFVRRLWEMEAYIFWMVYARKQAQGNPTAKTRNDVPIRAFEKLYVERERAVTLKRKIDAQPSPYSGVDVFDADGVWEQLPDYYMSEGYWVYGMTEARGKPYMTFDRSWQGIELLRSEISGFDLFEPLTKIGAEKHLFTDWKIFEGALSHGTATASAVKRIERVSPSRHLSRDKSKVNFTTRQFPRQRRRAFSYGSPFECLLSYLLVYDVPACSADFSGPP
ncbi:hypothetical protein DL768_011860 [Monosporascus sp. mg162]|nr:hypothetical protein DL768_011860 [Monosporascus sp. mg162]